MLSPPIKRLLSANASRAAGIREWARRLPYASGVTAAEDPKPLQVPLLTYEYPRRRATSDSE